MFSFQIIGSCVLAAGIIILLQLYVSNEPFGLGVKLSHREDGGSELVWILKLVGWFVTVFGILLVIIGFSGCTGSFGRVKRDYKVLGKVFLFIVSVRRLNKFDAIPNTCTCICMSEGLPESRCFVILVA